MTARDTRRSFLDYFAKHGHQVVESASLVPIDDPTLLFTNAGMNQFKSVLQGREQRGYTRAVSSQKCMRVSGKHNDLNIVGQSPRHNTFFEMLGNFSFGDYFKSEAIAMAWVLLTEEWKLEPSRLRVTVFSGDKNVPRDDEAYSAWQKFLPADRIDAWGAADNFWTMGETGPCGRCSEIHLFLGDDPKCTEPTCRGTACSCHTYIELWNNVFMEFDRQDDGTLKPLPMLSIDTGMSLERATVALQGVDSVYETDLFQPLLQAIAELVGTPYGKQRKTDVSMHVIADHLRAMTFLISDLVTPSNEWRGYVLRKIMRRAMRHSKQLGLTEPSLHRLVDVVVQEMGDTYPALSSNRDRIVNVVRKEEDRFDTVLNTGLAKLEEVLDRAETGNRCVTGEDVFRLYDSLGLPAEFVEDLAGERQLSVDWEGFERLMAKQRDQARAASGFKTKRDGASTFWTSEALDKKVLDTQDRFEGYETTRIDGGMILMLWNDAPAPCTQLDAGNTGYFSLDRSPFYVEAGGQVSDTGHIVSHDGKMKAVVEDMALWGSFPRLHRIRVIAGTLSQGDVVSAVVDAPRRRAIQRNHTATHLLHAALRQVLGHHVTQAGSLVSPERLRFDFTHPTPLSQTDVEEIERLVNEQVLTSIPVDTVEQPTDEAISNGAIALFGEKYGDRVRVVSISDFSKELCGGTHCCATGEIGSFLIEQESGTAAGVRRLEAVTGTPAIQRQQARRSLLNGILQELASPETRALDVLKEQQAQTKQLARDVKILKLKLELASETATHIDIDGVTLLTRRADGLDKGSLRTLADQLKGNIKSGLVVLASATEAGQVVIIVSVTPDLKARVPAGQVVKALAVLVGGGGGGGRPDFAEAGGKEPQHIDHMLSESENVVRSLLDNKE